MATASSPAALEATVEKIVADVQATLRERRSRARGSTYRLQFHAKFTFRDATAIVPYLASLGVTHLYASPYLKAQPGSQHGYDVCDHNQLNPELGTGDDYAALVAALKQHNIGHILDVVPNHMAASSHNPWWTDLLENGPNSPYAHYFDVDWSPIKDELQGRVLLPILGKQYGEALEAGELQLRHREGGFFLDYFDHALPISPKSIVPIFQHRLDELRLALGEQSEHFLEYQSIITATEHLPPQSATSLSQVRERQREKEVIKRRLRTLETAEPLVSEFLQRNLAEFNGRVGDVHSFDKLDALLLAQAYRLSHWRAASDEVNYRRFFDINSLAAVSMEAIDVFEESHRLVLQLLGNGDVDGLRIDHIDGLYDPTQYLWRLQWAYLSELARRAFERHVPKADDAPPTLSEPTFEQLPPTTSADGTVGEPTPATPPQPAPLTFAQLRPKLLRALCDQLKLPQPDLAFLGIEAEAESPTGEVLPAPVPLRADAQLDCDNCEWPLYVVVEKILGPDEPLPPGWPVAGTSGYDFLQQLNGLYVEKDGLDHVRETYCRFTEQRQEFSSVVYRCKQLILDVSMSSELQMLAHRLNQISEQHRRSRDFTLNTLRRALADILAYFPVYRTYPGPGGVSERDRKFVLKAVAHARRNNPAMDAAVFDFLRQILLLEHPEGTSEAARRERELFTGRFQQVTSPVMAKGVEDTAFYLYAPLLSINEVGSHPESAVPTVENFHRDNLDRHTHWPQAMTCTTTHDTKRSQDVRARINVLTEIPNQWRKAVTQWGRNNRRLIREVDGLPAPSRNDEHLFYQSLIGMWPTQQPTAEELPVLIERLRSYMEKATREAKARTSWVSPNKDYDEAVREFVAAALTPKSSKRFLADLQRFQETTLDWGLYTALSQLAVKLMSPGIPDTYQGQEVWDFSLVDPDNRRPVDYASRTAMLAAIEEAAVGGPESRLELARRLGRSPRDPRLKLLAASQLLRLRRDRPQLFIQGNYEPLTVSGPCANHLCAFAWRDASSAGSGAILIAPRFIARFCEPATPQSERRLLTDAAAWGETTVQLGEWGTADWTNVMTGANHTIATSIAVGELFADFPVIVLATA